MSRKKISQNAARSMRKELHRLRDERAALFAWFNRDGYVGVDLGTEQVSVQLWTALNTAAKLGYAVIVKPGDNYKMNFRAAKA